MRTQSKTAPAHGRFGDEEAQWAGVPMTDKKQEPLPSDTEILDALLFDDRLDLRHRREDGTWAAGDLESGKVVALERDPRKAIAVFMLRASKQPCSLSYPTKMTCACRRTPAPAREDLAKVVSPLIEWLTQAIHPRYERDDDGHLDTTKPERTHFIGNLLWIAEIQMLALVIDALRASPPSKSEDEVRAEDEILDKSIASMNLAAAYLWKAAEAVGASHPSDPCVFHAQRLQIAAGAIHRMLAIRAGKRELVEAVEALAGREKNHGNP